MPDCQLVPSHTKWMPSSWHHFHPCIFPFQRKHNKWRVIWKQSKVYWRVILIFQGHGQVWKLTFSDNNPLLSALWTVTLLAGSYYVSLFEVSGVICWTIRSRVVCYNQGRPHILYSYFFYYWLGILFVLIQQVEIQSLSGNFSSTFTQKCLPLLFWATN